jgi:hypothetical protein
MIVRLRSVQTWLVIARDASGREIPVGLVSATDARMAVYRGTIKATQLLGSGGEHKVIVRPAP